MVIEKRKSESELDAMLPIVIGFFTVLWTATLSTSSTALEVFGLSLMSLMAAVMLGIEFWRGRRRAE